MKSVLCATSGFALVSINELRNTNSMISFRSMKRGVILGAALLVIGPLVAVACNSGGSPDAGNPCSNGSIALPNCDAVITDGGTRDLFSDEACLVLEDALGRNLLRRDDALAPRIDVPQQNAMVSAATPFTFQWTPQGIARWSVEPSGQAVAAWESPATSILHELDPLPSAEAHCSPFTGVGYALTVRDANGMVVYRAETSRTSHTPDSIGWAKIVGTGTSRMLDVTVTATRFNANVIDMGPAEQTTPRRFVVGP